MKFEIEKAKDGTFTTRIKVNGKVTFSNNGLNSKQAAYKKIIGLYNGVIASTGIKINSIAKKRSFPEITITYENVKAYIYVKEINC